MANRFGDLFVGEAARALVTGSYGSSPSARCRIAGGDRGSVGRRWGRRSEPGAELALLFG